VSLEVESLVINVIGAHVSCALTMAQHLYGTIFTRQKNTSINENTHTRVHTHEAHIFAAILRTLSGIERSWDRFCILKQEIQNRSYIK